MPKETQISARMSETTRDLMEKHLRRTGVKKGHLVEPALPVRLKVAMRGLEEVEGYSRCQRRLLGVGAARCHGWQAQRFPARRV